jgi:hypothetical protein
MQTTPLDDLLYFRRISRTPKANLQPFGFTQILALLWYLSHFKVHFFPIDAKVQKISIKTKKVKYNFYYTHILTKMVLLNGVIILDCGLHI